MGSSDAQIEEYKKKLQFLENELSTSRDTNKTSHEKHQETLSRLNRQLQATEQQYKDKLERLQRELDLVKESGRGVNDTLLAKDYSKAERTEKPRASLSSVIADEQKQKEKGKEKEREDKGKEREDKERHDRQREEREKQDKERDEREKQEREKQSAAFKQKTAELEAKYKQAAEQVFPPPISNTIMC